MIATLSKLTMRAYVDLMCGDTSVLLADGTKAADAELRETRRKMLYEYSRLSDSAGTMAVIGDYERSQRAKAEHTLFQVLTNLLAIGAHDDVRRILREYGISREFDDKQLAAEVGRLLRRAETNLKKTRMPAEQKKEPTPDEIRAQFDRQAASLMTYYKFQIDFNTISASQFACMIDQAHKEIKKRLAETSRK